MSPQPGRVVLDEPVPFPVEGRDASVRLEPDFQAFRRRIGERIGAHV